MSARKTEAKIRGGCAYRPDLRFPPVPRWRGATSNCQPVQPLPFPGTSSLPPSIFMASSTWFAVELWMSVRYLRWS